MPLVNWDQKPEPDVRRAAGELIHAHADWTWFVTLTFFRPVSESHADQTFRRWMRELARAHVHEHIPVAWTIEHAGKGWHIHALLAMPADRELTDRYLTRVWHGIDPAAAGFTDIQRYDPEKGLGAAIYMTKTTNWSINMACSRPPRCRRTHCVQAPGAW